MPERAERAALRMSRPIRIAVLGASSLIARDLADRLAPDPAVELLLFSRNPTAPQPPRGAGLPAIHSYAAFADGAYDAILNFVGTGTPAATRALGSEILDVSLRYDTLALDYLDAHPGCRYVFLSSGVAYGSDFSQPASAQTPLVLHPNGEPPPSYTLAKLICEWRHRARPHQAIVDVRIFNYFSRRTPVDAGFLASDAVQAILGGGTLSTSSEPLTRDYLDPDDFHQLVLRVLEAPPANAAADAYSRSPITRQDFLALLQERFGMRFEVAAAPQGAPPTGLKANYFSTYRKAAEWGYEPLRSSGETLVREIGALLAARGHPRGIPC